MCVRQGISITRKHINLNIKMKNTGMGIIIGDKYDR